MKFLSTVFLLSCLAASSQVPARIGGAVAGERVAGLVTTVADSGGGGSGSEFTLIPATNRIDWTLTAGLDYALTAPAGTNTITGLDSTGATDVSASLATQLNATASNWVAYLPSGVYRVDNPTAPPNGVRFWGAGSNTIVVATNSMYIGTLDTYGQTTRNVSAGYGPGSTNLTLASAVAGTLTNGSMVLLSELNDTNYVHPWGYEDNMTAPLANTNGDDPDGGTRMRGQVLKVLSVGADDLSLVTWPPIVGIGFGGGTPRIRYLAPLDPPAPLNVAANISIGHMTWSNSTGSAFLVQGARNTLFTNLWGHIGVGDQPFIKGSMAHRTEVMGCWFTGHTGGASAIVPNANCDGWLVVNNIFLRCNQSVLINGRGGHHFVGYNYSIATNTSTALIAEMGTHGCHTEYILWEGNKFTKGQEDSVHGSGTYKTWFRNHASGQHSFTTFGHGCLNIDSWQYHHSIVGNVWGTPGDMSGWIYEERSPADNSTNAIHAWGYSGYNPYNTGTNSKAFAVVSDNYNFVSNAQDVTSGASLPASLFYTNAPGWFAGFAWPPIGPDTTGYYTNRIPAEARLNGF